MSRKRMSQTLALNVLANCQVVSAVKSTTRVKIQTTGDREDYNVLSYYLKVF